MIATHSSWRIALASALALTLAACGGRGAAPRSASSAPAKAGPVERAVALLDTGDDKEARKLLQKALKKDEAGADARLLLNSIEKDPVALLGAANYPYVMRAGDTLKSLARRFLGSELKFYALARYNHVTVPNSVSLGQLVRIPGEAPKPKPDIAPAPERPAAAAKPEPTAKAKPKKEAPAAAAPVAPKSPVQDPALAARLRGAGLAALNQGNVARAVALLRRAAMLDPANPLIQRDLARAQRIAGTVQTKR